LIRILVADSSAVIRQILKEIIQKTKKLEWLGEAVSFPDMKESIAKLKPDFIIAGNQLFENEKENVRDDFFVSANIPSIFFYTKGDNDIPVINNIKFVEKPEFMNFSAQKEAEYALYLEQLVYDVKSAVLFKNHLGANSSATPTINRDGSISTFLKDVSKDYAKRNFMAVLVGVSTGGPAALQKLLKGIGTGFPLPIFITQHIDSFFDKNLITWLGKETSVPVHLAEDHTKPIAGHVYFAPSDAHLTFELDIDGLIEIALSHEAPVNFLRPAVDKMFESAANVMGGNCVAVVLTGMGSDGARECLRLKKLGAYTIAQDEESCVIYGMPKAAVEIGGVCEELPLGQIAERLWSLVERRRGNIA
jgi:two-component system chemotaxis response regulator CheB